MFNYTMKTHEMKRNFSSFLLPVVEHLKMDEMRFVADATYGILKSQSLHVSEIARNLDNETSQRGNFKRLDRHLKTFNEYKLLQKYHNQIKSVLGKEPLIMVDDSDIQKPFGKEFEDLGYVRDGSAKNKSTYGKGYNVAQMVGLTENTYQPVPVAHQIYSQTEREHKSQNYHTHQNIETVLTSFGDQCRCTFVFDRGYDDKKLMSFLDEKDADFVIRAGANRKYIIQDNKYSMAEVGEKYKGKYKHTIQFQGDYLNREVMISSTKVQLLEHDLETLSLVIAYGIGEKPMFLLTNKDVSTKESCIKIFNMYILRWRIEEFFRIIKTTYGFEDMRVMTLKRMNTLSWMLQIAIGYQSWFIETQQKNQLFQKVIAEAKAYKEKVSIWLYQISKGLAKIFSRAHTNVHELMGIKRTSRERVQLSLF